jgi:hypothetical protein
VVGGVAGMSPVEVVDARSYSLRHVHPTATYASEGGTATVLGRTYGFTWLHQAHIPTDHGFVEGSYTTRLGDSGEFSVTFPNAVGALGPWRERFSGDGASEFIEIYRDDILEFVGCIQRVEIDRGSVTISGPDAWGLLRRAYERDRGWTAAPQEVATAYTSVPVARVADNFEGSVIDGSWAAFGATYSIAQSDGRLRISQTSGASPGGLRRTIGFTYDRWEISVSYRTQTANAFGVVGLAIYGASMGSLLAYITFGDSGSITFSDAAIGYSRTLSVFPGRPVDHMPLNLTMRRQGRWLYAYYNGILLGTITMPTTTITDVLFMGTGNYGVGAGTTDIEEVSIVEWQPLLARGSDLGDYVLPGDQPTGGLRGRYFNLADLSGALAASRRDAAFAPGRGEPYAERLDASMDTASGLSLPSQPGNSGDYFAVRWFGSVYLRGDLGNYTFETTSVDDGVRVWVGKTAWGDQLIDDWTLSSGTNTGTWTASDYGSQAGWYPIVVEYFEDSGSAVFRLQFTPPASTYTDPGGTSITASTKITIPSTSLSPLGCYDNRVQGSAHFELVQGAAQAFGYDITLEPQSLESGEFPGRLVPRVRVGDDTDVILEPEDTDAAEPALNPGVTFDASDQTYALIGAGAGPADGISQTTAHVADLAAIDTGLFALEAWVDAGDIAFTDLLAARLNAELALRGTEWEEVRATPRAQERRADTWPLSGTHSAMMWRVGDGVRLRVPDIAVEDTEPRQIIQVTRTFNPEGRTGTQVAFRQRPRSQAKTVRGHLRSALALGRTYQRQKITINGQYIVTTVAAGAFSDFSRVTLLPGDKVVRAVFRLVVNTGLVSVGLLINGSDRTAALGGGWSTLPVEIDITGYATQATTTDNRLYATMQNNGGVSSNLEGIIVVEVLR